MPKKKTFSDEERRQRRIACTKRWRAENPSLVKILARKSYQTNRESILAKKRANHASFYAKNAVKISARAKALRKKHPHKLREKTLRIKYKLTVEAYQALIDSQGYRCASCSRDLRTLPRHEVQIDHCHHTGAVRAILCGLCNRALGLLGDDPARVQLLANYIARFSARP